MRSIRDDVAKRLALRRRSCKGALQSSIDVLLGYTTIDGRPYYVRQMKNMKASIPAEWLEGQAFHEYAFACGAILARAHARTGDAAMYAASPRVNPPCPRAHG